MRNSLPLIHSHLPHYLSPLPSPSLYTFTFSLTYLHSSIPSSSQYVSFPYLTFIYIPSSTSSLPFISHSFHFIPTSHTSLPSLQLIPSIPYYHYSLISTHPRFILSYSIFLLYIPPTLPTYIHVFICHYIYPCLYLHTGTRFTNIPSFHGILHIFKIQ